MKTITKLSILVLLALFSYKAYSQGSSLIVFTEKGEKFTVFMNGDQKNSKPGDYVRVDNIHGPTFKVRVVFADPAIKEISKTEFNSPSGEMYYVAKPGKKGDYILEKTSSDYVHHADPVNTEQTQKAATENNTAKQTAAATAEAGSTSKAPCKTPMAEGDFQASVAMISAAPFEGPKLNSAKKMVESHCLTSDQIREVMFTVSHDASRLTIAKSAYLHCSDPSHYDIVRNELSSTKSKEELDQYIASQK
jgi:hypothetical protein